MNPDLRLIGRESGVADPADQQFRLLVSSVTDYAIFLLDGAGRITSWNAGAERIKGYRAEEIIGRHFSHFYTAEDRERGLPDNARATARRNGRFQGEGWRQRRDGTRFWAEVTITALHGESGAFVGFAKVTRDMTARHLAREREQLFAATFDGAPSGITVLDLAGDYIGANASFLRLMGYGEEELKQKSMFDLTHAEDLAGARRGFNDLSSGSIDRLELDQRYLHRDGRAIWVHVTLARIVDGEGVATSIVTQVEDMTERRAAEARVRESEERLRAFTAYSPALMCMKDREGRYRFANDRFLERYNLRREQLLGRTDAELFTRRQALALSAHDAEVLSRGEAMQYEERAAAGDGQRVSMVWKFPVLDAAGAPQAIGVVSSDITDRRLTEQALREQRTLLAEAQKIAGLGSWDWDPDSGRVSWSGELYRMFGVSPDDMAPSFENYLERVHPDDRQQSGAMVARALMDSRPFSMLERIVRPGGEVRYVRSQGEVVRNERGKPIKVLVACLDITEQRHSESALRQAAQDLHGLSQRLVQAEEIERRRVARELHDQVGQSLSALNINLDIISRERGSLPAQLRQRLDDSLGLVESTAQAIENVMADLRPPLLDEYGLAAALNWHADEFTRRTGVQVTVIDSTPEATKKARHEAAVALFRIAQESLNNVLKHAQAKSVRIEVLATGEDLVLDVRDDGRGFDPGAAPAGRWGMTTMRERAQAAGGQLHIDTAPGRGTRIHARVPL